MRVEFGSISCRTDYGDPLELFKKPLLHNWFLELSSLVFNLFLLTTVLEIPLRRAKMVLRQLVILRNHERSDR